MTKLTNKKLLQVLRRLQVPPPMLQAITHIYDSPQFRVFAGHTESEYLIQRSGIRQGCPLSPYLFVLLMAAMFSDIKARLNTPKQREPIEGIQYSEVLYADDTLIFGNYTYHINLLLKEIQTESRYYNMELNLDKCINLYNLEPKAIFDQIHRRIPHTPQTYSHISRYPPYR